MLRFFPTTFPSGRLLALFLAGLLLGACETEQPEAMAPAEVGSWSLVSVEARNETGDLVADTNWEKGILMLDGNHYAMQMVRPNRPAVTNAAEISKEEAHALLEGYRSSNGSYTPAETEGSYRIRQETGLFALSPEEWLITVEGDRLQTALPNGNYSMTWERIQSSNPTPSDLVGMWRLVKAERRTAPDSAFVPAFPGAGGFTTFDEHGNRLWDVSFAGRTPLSYSDAMAEERTVEELRGMIQTYLVGIVTYEVNPDSMVLTQVENDGVIPGAGFPDWTYAINEQGQLALTLANGMFRATYKPWTD